MNKIIHILKYKILLFLKFNTPVTPATIMTGTGSFLVYLLFAAGCYIFTHNTIEYLLTGVKIGSFLLHRFIMIILFLFFVSINIGNIVVSFSTLYRSGEINYFFTKPISFAKIFLIKFLDNFFYSSTTLLFIIFSVIAGYGAYFLMPWYFYPIALLLLILPFMFTAGSLGVMILLIVLRLASKLGLRRVIIIIAVLYSVFISLFYLISSPITLVEKVFQYYPDINRYFGFLESDLLKLLPNYWIAEALYWFSQGDTGKVLPYIIINILTSIIVFTSAVLLARKWYYTTWLTSLTLNTDFKFKHSFKKSILKFENDSILSRLNEVIIKRETLLFFREPSQWIHMAVMLFLIFVFLTSISRINLMIMKSYDINLKALVYLIVFLFNVFLTASLALRFVFPLISLEGEALWKIKSAPVNYSKFLLKKLGIYFVFILLTSIIISFFSNLQFPPVLGFAAVINSILITITLVALNFGMGGVFANYKERNPIRIASSQGASLTFLFTIIYLFLLIAVLFVPVYRFFAEYNYGRPVSLLYLFIPSIFLFSVALLTGYLMIKIGINSFKKDI